MIFLIFKEQFFSRNYFLINAINVVLRLYLAWSKYYSSLILIIMIK